MKGGVALGNLISAFPHDTKSMIFGCRRKSGDASGRQCEQGVLRK